jgi:hypothetical protein
LTVNSSVGSRSAPDRAGRHHFQQLQDACPCLERRVSPDKLHLGMDLGRRRLDGPAILLPDPEVRPQPERVPSYSTSFRHRALQKNRVHASLISFGKPGADHLGVRASSTCDSRVLKGIDVASRNALSQRPITEIYSAHRLEHLPRGARLHAATYRCTSSSNRRTCIDG